MSTAQKETVQNVLLGIYRGLLGIGMAVGAWLANQVWADVKDLPNKLDARVQHIEQTTAVLLDSRYTASDALRLKEELSADLQRHEYRITSLETLQATLGGSLQRIEQSLKTK